MYITDDCGRLPVLPDELSTAEFQREGDYVCQ